MSIYTIAFFLLRLIGPLLLTCANAQQPDASESAPFINTWPVAGTLDNDNEIGGYL